MPRRSSRLSKKVASLPSSKPLVSGKPSLPPEILAQIIQQVAYNYFSYDLVDSVRYKTLRRLCLVSKAFLPVARSALYGVVFLEYNDGPDEEELEYEYYYALDDEFMDEPIEGDPILPPETPPFRDQALLKSLRRYPHLRPLVRQLVVTYSFKQTTDRMADAEATLGKLFQLCRRITRLGLRNGEGSYHGDTSDLAEALSWNSNIDQVEEMEMVWAGPGCASLLKATPRLRRLIFTEGVNWTSSDVLQFEPASFDFHLDSLRVDWLPEEASVDEFLLSKSRSTISSLDVRLPIFLDISADLPSLTSLNLHFQSSPLSKERLDNMIASFARFPSLRTLRLFDLALPSVEVAPLLLLLPPIIELLSIRDSAIEKDAVLQYLKELPPRQGFALELKRRMKRSREIQEACSKAGVRLG
ncbi:hypothetical protein BCR35DRAFT_350632 [Leucosporidium creatinivorum]|uniref:F-box domain-containing protein n=1 Tax=Leucosporidium creatinivorum TaxID=106004 RepID=A0A1Y2FYK1_9BASI|nr:hypothetical protein BCR35DRAFT_350632 [Leucosporidium creatinivorum]